jgi:hypothetical protein
MVGNKILALILVFIALSITIWIIYYKLVISPSIKIDFDEPIYYSTGIDLAECLLRGNIACLATYNRNIEHPFFAKILYGLTIIFSGKIGSSMYEGIMYARNLNIYLSSITVFVLTLISPFSGILFAGEPLAIKYGLEVYLDGIATLFVTLSYLPLVIGDSLRPRNILLSAIFSGLAIATKYTAIPALLPIPIYLFMKSFISVEKRGRSISLSIRPDKNYIVYGFTWLVLSAIIFYIADPSIWFDLGKPLTETRLYHSLIFHEEYAMKTSMEKPLPTLQQFLWIINHSAEKWHPGVFIIDTGVIILILGFLGLPLTIIRKPLIGYWIISYTLFLIIWPVKWPQYTLLLTAPLSISSSILLEEIIRGLIWFAKHLMINAKLSITVLIISILLFSIMPPLINTSSYSVMHTQYYIDTKTLHLDFEVDGLKPIHGVLKPGYVFIKPVKRGIVYNLPYEYLPTINNKWPGILYNAKYVVNSYIRGEYIHGLTIINYENTSLVFEKIIEKINDSCIHVKYLVRNTGGKDIYFHGQPSWANKWGLGIELAISPPDPENYEQLIITSRNETIILHENWHVRYYNEGVKAIGLRNTHLGFSIIIKNINYTSGYAVWLEYGKQWITIRLTYRPVKIPRGKIIVYNTYWCIVGYNMAKTSKYTKYVAQSIWMNLDIRKELVIEYIVLVIAIIIYMFIKTSMR